MNWKELTNEERLSKIDKLREVCEEMMEHHPDYKSFIKVFITHDDKTCRIKWNGRNLDEVSGWGLVTLEIPVDDIPVVTKRFSDQIKYRITNELEGVHS